MGRWLLLASLLAACGTPAARVAVSPTPTPTPTATPTPTPTPTSTSTPTSESAPRHCPDSEVWIPPTSPDGFVMGKGAKGEHRVVLTHGFCIDATEVPVRDYAKCVDAGSCAEPWRGDPWSTYPGKPDHPVNMVSWKKAHAFCAWSGKRLPTDAEWEWAATGPEQTKYPWGDEPEPSCEYVDYTKFGAPKWAAGADVGCDGGGPSPVGSHPKGDKTWPEGAIHDLAGNVWEWVEDSYAPYSGEAQSDPVVRTSAAVHPLRGGGWNRSYAAMVVTYRGAAHFSYQVPALGFRCVRGEPLATPSPTHDERAR